MSNPDARTLPYVLSAPGLTLKQNTDAPIQPAPRVATSNQVSTAALPPPLAPPTAWRITRRNTGTARPDPCPRLATLLISQQQRRLPLLPPITHPTPTPNPPPDSCFLPIQTAWTPNLMIQGRLHTSPHLPPQASSPLSSLQPQGPLFAPHSWVPWDPPQGLVAPNPMGRPASPPLLETRQTRASKCLIIHPLTLFVYRSTQRPRELGCVSFAF